MSLTSDYIVGLVDGEGSFTVYVRDPKDTAPRVRRVLVEPRFYLKLIAKDKIILENLRIFFECGAVYVQRDQRANHQLCYRYEVANREHLVRVIIPFFQKHILKFPSKRKDFLVFCKMMEIISNKRHLTPDGLQKLFELKQTMH